MFKVSLFKFVFMCALDVLLVFSVLYPTGLTGPAHTDSGDAPHRAHFSAEHGSAACREAGQLGGEQ